MSIRSTAAAAAACLIAFAAPASAKVINLDFDLTPTDANFFDFSTFDFFQIGAPQPLPPSGPVSLDVGDTVNIAMRFTDGLQVRVNGPTTTEVSTAFFTASGTANGGTPPVTDLTFSFDFEFLGASGDLLIPSLSIPSLRAVGGNMVASVSDQFTTSGFQFSGVAYSFTVLSDNKADNGETDPSQTLPLNFDVAAYRILTFDTLELVEARTEVAAPSTLPLLGAGAIAGLFFRIRRKRVNL